MKAQGIQTSIHYPPIHHFSAYQEITNAELPVTEDVVGREVTLPLYPAMSDEDIVLVAKTIRDVLSLPVQN